MGTYLDGMNGGKHNSDNTIASFTPKNKINAGDKVTTKTDAVYQPTQQSLNNLTGTVFFIVLYWRRSGIKLLKLIRRTTLD